MKIYTKTGDKGFTSIIGGEKLLKSDLRIEAYGSIDELIAYVGLIRSYNINETYKKILLEIQDRLMLCCAIIANPNNVKNLSTITENDLLYIEKEIDTMEMSLSPLQHFILPGGNQVVSFCHICRTTCRRAERSVIRLAQEKEVKDMVIKYLNRISDYFFVLSRKMSVDYNCEEIPWKMNR